MGKVDFIKRLAQCGYTKKDAQTVYEDFVSVMRGALVNGEPVMIPGIGTFLIKERKGREITLFTGETYAVKDHLAVTFKASQSLKDDLNHKG